jgi:hypothetical protein
VWRWCGSFFTCSSPSYLTHLSITIVVVVVVVVVVESMSTSASTFDGILVEQYHGDDQEEDVVIDIDGAVHSPDDTTVRFASLINEDDESHHHSSSDSIHIPLIDMASGAANSNSSSKQSNPCKESAASVHVSIESEASGSHEEMDLEIEQYLDQVYDQQQHEQYGSANNNNNSNMQDTSATARDLLAMSKRWPEFEANLIDRLTFGWMGALLALGYRVPLALTDLWSLHAIDTARVNAKIFRARWSEARQAYEIASDCHQFHCRISVPY